jgi:hypothetical protein
VPRPAGRGIGRVLLQHAREAQQFDEIDAHVREARVQLARQDGELVQQRLVHRQPGARARRGTQAEAQITLPRDTRFATRSRNCVSIAAIPPAGGPTAPSSGG